MDNDVKKTKANILEAAKAEFMEKGFEKSSLRNIVKSVGMTTGAFYGYFKSKEELFEAIVSEPAEKIMRGFDDRQKAFSELPKESQKTRMGVDSAEWMKEMSPYIYGHRDEFKLILCKSQGTQYENFIHQMVTKEEQATEDFLKVLEELGHPVKKIDGYLSHLLVSGFFTSYFETVIHDMPEENMVDYTDQLNRFYVAGWSEIMGL